MDEAPLVITLLRTGLRILGRIRAGDNRIGTTYTGVTQGFVGPSRCPRRLRRESEPSVFEGTRDCQEGDPGYTHPGPARVHQTPLECDASRKSTARIQPRSRRSGGGLWIGESVSETTRGGTQGHSAIPPSHTQQRSPSPSTATHRTTRYTPVSPWPTTSEISGPGKPGAHPP